MTDELEDQDRLLCVGTNSSFKELMKLERITTKHEIGEREFGVGEVGKGQIDQGMWTQKTKMLKVITEKTEKTIKKYW
nr:7751_t:CDS:2 [Entrophospora candida]